MTDEVEGGAGAESSGASAKDTTGELMVARVSAESQARQGQKMRLVIDSTKIRLFDAETEQAIL